MSLVAAGKYIFRQRTSLHASVMIAERENILKIYYNGLRTRHLFSDNYKMINLKYNNQYISNNSIARYITNLWCTWT